MCVRVDNIERQVAVGRFHVHQENDDEIEKIVDKFHAVGDSQSSEEGACRTAQLGTA